MVSRRYRRQDLSLTLRLELGDRVLDALETENRGANASRVAVLGQRFDMAGELWDVTRLARSLGEAIRRGDSEAVDRLQRVLGAGAWRRRPQR